MTMDTAFNSRVENDVQNEICELNRSLLLLAQRMAGSERTSLEETLGVRGHVADLLAGLSKEQVERLARTGQLLWRFRWDAITTFEALSTKAKGKVDILAQPEPSTHPAG
jgi:hypothetical protein